MIAAKLPESVRQELARVSIDVRKVPGPLDISRGCDPMQVAYFFGTRRADDYEEGNTLPDPAGPEGELVIFLKNAGELTFGKLEGIVLHELAHALGYDEEEIVTVMGYDPCR
jgi:hypothetical protein